MVAVGFWAGAGSFRREKRGAGKEFGGGSVFF